MNKSTYSTNEYIVCILDILLVADECFTIKIQLHKYIHDLDHNGDDDINEGGYCIFT